MKHKFILFTIMAAAFLFMTGCNLKEKIGESITEGILDKALGEDADVDLDSGEITFSGEDGEEITIDDENGFVMEGEDGTIMASGGDYEWPDSHAAEYIPKCDRGKITYIYNAEDGLMLNLEETELEDYEDYLEDVIDAGYTEDKWESTAEDLNMYTAKASNGATITVAFTPSEGFLQITVDVSEVE